MQEIGIKNPEASITSFGIKNAANVYWNLTPEELVEHTLKKEMGSLTDSGALHIKTGAFTGRSPKDRYIVSDRSTAKTVDWGSVNKPFESRKFNSLWRKVCAYLKKKDIYVRDSIACASANPAYRLKLRVATEYPWSNQFAYNMFLRVDPADIPNFDPQWEILCAPGFKADPERDGTEAENFAIINISKRRLLIGGTGYTGEIKKGIFSVINFLLPTTTKNVLPMHCSANVGQQGDIALFFGLSGTGKTTLSTDPNRPLIGDDEHAWSEEEVFNFEGGCYAKTIDLSAENEPDIFHAIRHGAILENQTFVPNTRTPDYADSSITQNTRVSYPIHHINNALVPSHALGQPNNVFFLTADAFGVLPPISKLTPEQAMYYFMSGYTAKVAGTEVGIVEPKATFSACFGAPFLPLHPARYAAILGKKLRKTKANVWLINTGWSGGPYGVGNRMKLSYTRAMITAALEGELNQVEYIKDEVFKLSIPTTCPNVPDHLLNPRETWASKNDYDEKANYLASLFVKNFQQYEEGTSPDILSAAPKVMAL